MPLLVHSPLVLRVNKTENTPLQSIFCIMIKFAEKQQLHAIFNVANLRLHCQQRSAMSGMGCTGKAYQTSNARQFLDYVIEHGRDFIFNCLRKPKQFSQEWWSMSTYSRGLENESVKHSFEPFQVCWWAVEAFLTTESYSSQDMTIPRMWHWTLEISHQEWTPFYCISFFLSNCSEVTLCGVDETLKSSNYFFGNIHFQPSPCNSSSNIPKIWSILFGKTWKILSTQLGLLNWNVSLYTIKVL